MYGQQITIDSESFLELLSDNSCLKVNRTIMKTLGPTEAIFIAEMLSGYKEHLASGKIDGEGFFHHSQELIENNTGIGLRHQTRIIGKLKDIGILQAKLIGMPAENYYRLDLTFLARISGQKFNPAQSRQNSETDKIASKLSRRNSSIIYNTAVTSRQSNFKKEKEEKKEGKGIELIRRQDLERKSEILSQGIKDQAKAKAKDKILVIPKSIAPYIHVWNHFPGTKNILSPNSKFLAASVKSLRKIIRGSFFNNLAGFEKYADRAFSLEEWTLSLSRFNEAIINPNVFPPDKRTYKNMSLSSFLYHTYNRKSRFIMYLEGNPRPVPSIITDDNPTLTSTIVNLYARLILNAEGYAPSPTEMNKFVEASRKLVHFIGDNQDKIAEGFLAHNTSFKWAEWLIQSIISENPNIPIIPGFLCSDTTFTRRLPYYLTQQGVLTVQRVSARVGRIE